MARKAKERASGGRLSRSETVTVRLDPRLNYLSELAARVERRTKSSFIEAMLEQKVHETLINPRSGSETVGGLADKADHLVGRGEQVRGRLGQLHARGQIRHGADLVIGAELVLEPGLGGDQVNPVRARLVDGNRRLERVVIQRFERHACLIAGLLHNQVR